MNRSPDISPEGMTGMSKETYMGIPTGREVPVAPGVIEQSDVIVQTEIPVTEAGGTEKPPMPAVGSINFKKPRIVTGHPQSLNQATRQERAWQRSRLFE